MSGSSSESAVCVNPALGTTLLETDAGSPGISRPLARMGATTALGLLACTAVVLAVVTFGAVGVVLFLVGASAALLL